VQEQKQQWHDLFGPACHPWVGQAGPIDLGQTHRRDVRVPAVVEGFVLLPWLLADVNSDQGRGCPGRHRAGVATLQQKWERPVFTSEPPDPCCCSMHSNRYKLTTTHSFAAGLGCAGGCVGVGGSTLRQRGEGVRS
jgi:hypothetical protein